MAGRLPHHLWLTDEDRRLVKEEHMSDLLLLYLLVFPVAYFWYYTTMAYNYYLGILRVTPSTLIS